MTGSSYKKWTENELAASLNRFPERYQSFYHHGGQEIPRLCVPASIDAEYEENLGFPGTYPFTRGVQPTMYRGRLWTMRQ
jgi:methylmalonyl-CoA mutase N-terminal domain/subunit